MNIEIIEDPTDGTPCEPCPIVGRCEDEQGRWVWVPSTASHIGGRTGAMADGMKHIDKNTTKHFLHMTDDDCAFWVRVSDFPHPDDLHPELRKELYS